MIIEPKEPPKWIVICCEKCGLELIGSEEDKTKIFYCPFCKQKMIVKEVEKKS